MFRRMRYTKWVVGGLAAAALAAPATALAGTSSLVVQGRALNARYGNAVTQLSSKEFSELWRDGGSKMSPQALNALVTSSQALNSQNDSSSAYRSLQAKGEALNARYGNAVTQLSSQEFGELWKDGGSQMSPQALNALVTRSQALNASGYSSGPAISVGNPGFQWSDFGLGAAVAAAAMILLALSMRFVTRGREQHTPTIASH